MLASRNFQASLKLLTATGSVLLATILLMALVPVAARSVPIFGYAAVVLCFQPRVEATVDQVRLSLLNCSRHARQLFPIHGTVVCRTCFAVLQMYVSISQHAGIKQER